MGFRGIVLAAVRYGLKRLSIDKFVGKGRGKIKRKCAAWARDFKALGCTRLILLHDSDDNRPQDLQLCQQALRDGRE